MSLALGAFFLFGPTGTLCGTTAAPGGPPSPPSCRSTTFFEVQSGALFPALGFVLVWTAAPLLAVAGTWPPRRSVPLVATATVIELTGIISLGGGILWAFTAGPLLVVASIASLRARVQ